MRRAIGLTASGERAWDGMLHVEAVLLRRHTRSARYRARRLFQGRPFDVYLPHFMLTEEDRREPPQALAIGLDRSTTAVKRLGFGDERHPLAAGVGVCELEWAEPKVNSVRYRAVVERQVVSLYVPNAVFESRPAPKRLFLRILEKVEA